MSYYTSNQPYNSAYHQKDGLANGAIIGTGLGFSAGLGAVHGVNRYAKKRYNELSARTDDLTKIHAQLKENPNSELGKKYNADRAELKADIDKFGEVGKYTDRFTSTKGRRLATYAGSALIGMGIGLGIDALNKQ